MPDLPISRMANPPDGGPTRLPGAVAVGGAATLPGLTGLRGVGALWVLAFHAQYGVALPVADAGFLGVDMFFILSGFVLCHAHGAGPWDRARYGSFLRGRFIRLFPLHWLCLGLVALAVVVLPEMRDAVPGRFDGAGLVASAALVQGWGLGHSAVWNLPAWSLSTEWLVSIAFPAFALAAGRVRRPGPALAACLACLAVFAAFLVLTGNPGTDVTARAGVVRTVLEFAAGCLLQRVHAGGMQPERVAACGAAVAVAVGVLVPGWSAAAVFGFPVVILLAARPGSPVARAMSGRTMLVLGEMSFSIYLLHWVVLQVSDRLAALVGVQGPAASAAWFCGVLAVLLAMAAATFRLVEMPARDWARRRQGWRTGVPAGSSSRLSTRSSPVQPAR